MCCCADNIEEGMFIKKGNGMSDGKCPRGDVLGNMCKFFGDATETD